MGLESKIGTIWSEIDPRFTQNAEGNLKVVANVASVMSAIDNILRTRKGERVMLPTFGSDLMDAVFEPMTSTTIKFLSRSLKEDIEQWDDRVLIQDIQIYSNPDTSSVSITILFGIKGYDNIFKYETEVKGEG